MAAFANILDHAEFAVAETSGLEQATDGVWLTSPDASIRLVPRRPLPPGLYELTIELSSRRLSDADFEFEFGREEQAELRAIPLAYLGEGRYGSVCDVPEPLAAMIIRPNAPGDRLAIARLSLRRLGPLSRLRLLGGRALELLRREPRALFAAFRRYRAGVVRGDVIVSRRGADTQPGSYERWLATFDDDPARDAPFYRERLARSAPLPSFAVFVLLDSFDRQRLDRTIVSLLAQLHGSWELHLIATAELKPRLAALIAAGPERDKRIRLLVRQPGDEAATALNDALSQTGADWVVRFEAGDLLRPHALAEFALTAKVHPSVAVIYADEDRVDAKGRRHTPFFKPDWSPDLLRSWNYVGRAVAWRAEGLRQLGGWRAGFEAASDHDLNLRLTEALTGDRLRHVAKVLVHIESGAPDPARPFEPAAAAASTRAVTDHLERTGRFAYVEPVAGRSVLSLRYVSPAPPPLVSIIIPTRDRLPLLRGCISSILERTTYAAFEVIVVDNGSREPETLRYLAGIEGRVRVLPVGEPFNFSRLNNLAVREARGNVIALVNNDIEVVTGEWLDEMVGHALRPEIGCVGAKLLYPDGTVQHAGIVLGLGGVAGHAHKGLPGSEPGYAGRAIAACNVSAVTAACLVVRRSVYEAVGGLDEELAVAFNDVDFCLKVLRAGYLNLWTPFAELRHHESASRGAETSRAEARRFAAEIQRLKRRWGTALRRDPYYSPQLTVLREDYSLRP